MPVVRLSAARFLRGWPPAEMNCPPTYTRVPATARQLTSVSAAGSQAWMLADEASIEARRARFWVPAVMKSPPASTLVPLTARASTKLSRFGFQFDAPPWLLFTAARLFLVELPIMLKLPPR